MDQSKRQSGDEAREFAEQNERAMRAVRNSLDKLEAHVLIQKLEGESKGAASEFDPRSWD